MIRIFLIIVLRLLKYSVIIHYTQFNGNFHLQNSDREKKNSNRAFRESILSNYLTGRKKPRRIEQTGRALELRRPRRNSHRRRHSSGEELRKRLAVVGIGEEARDEGHGSWAKPASQTRPTAEERLHRGPWRQINSWPQRKCLRFRRRRRR